ncbi:type II secretion system protein GspL [Paraglaciecola psychrophila]|uniref:Type II secretion system protein L n=1 Tax=Paraglaciecola psychrophila 170 TaxID=1129794 RepID=K7AY47_9ALTE|nr:type II secretion system protein GspL [Paraglaciecola psychrophila]AGH47573.1 general secretion pathway protein L [Paraglaciecola psychrophila 170]GAC40030.1 general secretion pathway protein L [Paraglaciecola psychrophila 170]
MEQLVVRLGANPNEPIHWIVWSGQQNEIIASGELPNAAQLATLGDRAGRRSICVLVPTSDVLLKWVELPAKAGRKALAAIPFILEEEISGDIAQQFFALGPKNGNKQAVAVVNKEKLQSWLNMIEDAGLTCDQVIPDVLALPIADKNAWSILELGRQLLVRKDDWAGLQGERDWLIQAINHHARQYAKLNQQALLVNDYSGTNLADVENLEVSVMPLELPMKVLAQGVKLTEFNLLQGEYKISNKVSGQWKKWRLAAVLAVIALFTTLIDKTLEQNRLTEQLATLKTQVSSEYKRAFPNAGAYRDLKTTMTRQMKALEQGGGGASMLIMLSQLRPAFEESQVKPQTMRFDSSRGELRIQVVARNFDALDQFKRQAEAQGFTVEQGSINQKDNQVIGSLSIRS